MVNSYTGKLAEFVPGTLFGPWDEASIRYVYSMTLGDFESISSWYTTQVDVSSCTLIRMAA